MNWSIEVCTVSGF